MTSNVLVGVAGAIPEPLLRAQSVAGKFFLMFFAIALFAVVFGLVLFLASLFKGRTGEKLQGVAVRRPRGRCSLAVGLMYPAILTIIQSFRGKSGEGSFSIEQLRGRCSPSPSCCSCCATPRIWVILVPFLATGVGLVYAILIDRARGEAFSKALIFLPMAISMVGASIIWKFVYQYKQTSRPQIGLLNAILKALGFETQQFLINAPLNTLHAHHRHGLDPGRLRDDRALGRDQGDPRRDHRGGQARRRPGLQDVPLHHPAEHPGRARRRHHDDRHRHAEGLRHRPDDDRWAVRHLGGRQRVLQPELPRSTPRGLGAALAVLLFVLVIPIVIYNIVQMRKEA